MPARSLHALFFYVGIFKSKALPCNAASHNDGRSVAHVVEALTLHCFPLSMVGAKHAVMFLIVAVQILNVAEVPFSSGEPWSSLVSIQSACNDAFGLPHFLDVLVALVRHSGPNQCLPFCFALESSSGHRLDGHGYTCLAKPMRQLINISLHGRRGLFGPRGVAVVVVHDHLFAVFRPPLHKLRYVGLPSETKLLGSAPHIFVPLSHSHRSSMDFQAPYVVHLCGLRFGPCKQGFPYELPDMLFLVCATCCTEVCCMAVLLKPPTCSGFPTLLFAALRWCPLGRFSAVFMSCISGDVGRRVPSVYNDFVGFLPMCAVIRERFPLPWRSSNPGFPFARGSSYTSLYGGIFFSSASL